MSIGGRLVGTPATRTKPSQVVPFTGAPVVYLETFPNDGDLGTATEDLTWVQGSLGGIAGVISGVATNTTGGGIGNAAAQSPTSSANVYVEAPLSNAGSVGGGSRGDVYLIGHADTTGEAEGFYLYVQSSSGDAATYVEIGEWTPGGGVIDSDTLISSANATWRLECVGTTITGLRNGVSVLTGVSSFSPQPAGAYAGFQIATPASPLAGLTTFEYGDL